jgi:hypothetical protein
MAIAGKGCFVAWYDLRPGSETEHDHWHTHEHMIERVAIPGFRRGLRYRALDEGPRVCIIYQVEALETLASPAYLKRLNNPTAWTTSSMPLIAGMNRTLCRVAATHGHGIGGYLLTVQFAPTPGSEDRLQSWLGGEAVPDLATRAGLCSAHLLIGDREVSQIKTQEKELRGGSDAVADWIALVEGYDRSATEQAGTELLGAAGLAAHGAADRLIPGLYSLDFAIEESEAKAIWRNPAAGGQPAGSA